MKTMCLHCKEREVTARGLCGACYGRWRRNGTLEYVKVKHVCRVDGCEEYVVSNGFCEKHRKRIERHGKPVQTRPFDWGKKAKHPHWNRWKTASRTCGLTKEWEDFWRFVSDIGDRPSERSILRRKDVKSPFRPDNFFWSDPVAEKPLSRSDPKEYARQFRKRSPRSMKHYRLRKTYGISVSDYEAMLEEQGGVCAICGGEEDHFSLSVDHCHDTGIIRGLLCNPCNRGLGYFRDKPELLKKAVAYLEARRL